MLRVGIAVVALCCLLATQSGAAEQPSLRASDDPLRMFLPENRSALLHIPDYDVLELAFPPELWRLIPEGRDAYLSSLAKYPKDVRRLVLLLGLGTAIHDDRSDDLWGYFGSPNGALAPEVLTALREADLTNWADSFADAVALFGPAYPVLDRDRSKFFAHSFLRVREGIVPDLSAPPTAVEQRLREPGCNFAGKTRFRQDLVDHVRGNAELSSALARARQNLGDAARLAYLRQQLPFISGFGEMAQIREQIERVPQAYRTVLVLSLLESEILNGGLAQFFSNSSGAFAEYAARALHDLEQDASAAALEQAIALFGSVYPVATEERRRVYLAREQLLDRRLAEIEKRIDVGSIPAILTEAARRDGILPN